MTPLLWETLFGGLGFAVLVALWIALQGPTARRFRGAVAFFAIAAALYTATPWAPERSRTLDAALTLIAFCFGCVRLAIVAVDVVARRRDAHFSTILLELLTLVLYGVVLMVVAGGVLGMAVTPLLATSALVTAVIGLALQETLSNVFSGLSLQMEKPFEPGDWIRVSGHLGRVQDIGLRSTKIITRSLELIDIPNAHLAKELIINYRGNAIGDEHFIGLDYAVPPNRAKQVLADALRETPGIVSNPAPRAELVEYGDSAIRYRLRFWMNDYAGAEFIRDAVMTRVWYALRRHDIAVPYPVRVIERAQAGRGADAKRREEARIAALRHVDFLDGVPDEDLSVLSRWVHPATFASGEVVCREGDSGDTFYILTRGKAEVVAHDGRDGEMHVADLEAPSFFGEMSLLTDEPRSATVRAATDIELIVVEREGFHRLFQSRPNLAEAVSSAVAQYQTDLQTRREQRTQAVEPAERRSRRLLARMQAIFRL